MHPSVQCSAVDNSQDTEATKFPLTEEQIKMMWYIHIHNGILLSHQKEWNIAICSNMDGPGDDHTKWSKSDRKRQISYDIAYMWNLKKKRKRYKWTYLQNRNRLTDLENELMVTRGERWVAGEEHIGSLGLTCCI